MTIKKLISNHRNFFFILILALFLRAYRLDELTTFGGDQGQDFLVVRDMILYHKWTLLGIKTSIAPFFQGPIYLYILFPFFLLFNLDPIAGAVSAVLISMIALIVLYVAVNQFFSKNVAILSSLLYTFSPELIIYGNTPLYQNFLPLFIFLCIYFFIINEGKKLSIFLTGIFAGLCIGLHLLSITLGISLFVYLILYSKNRFQSTFIYAIGVVLALSPMIIFELRHQFLNTHLFFSYIVSPHEAISLSDKAYIWLKGSALFLGGKSMIIGAILFIFSFYALIKMKLPAPYIKLKKLMIILISTLLLFSFKQSALEPHYMLPLWGILIILLPLWATQIKPKMLGVGAILIIVGFNLNSSLKELNNNHGYKMPSGWTMRKIKETGKIISIDSKTRLNFNVASLLDGNTRTYPTRYAILFYGATPGAVEDYPNNDFLYVTSGGDKNVLHNTNTWEVASMRPFKIGRQWNLDDGVFLYRLDRIIQD